MDVFLLILGLILCITGIIGSFTPIIPGPLSSWLGILIIHFTSYIPFSNKLLITTFLIAFIVFLLDIFIPIIGLKKLGGSKKRINRSYNWINSWAFYRWAIRINSWSVSRRIKR
ncbi:DUF456 domain-containing protein [Flavobacteriaceae bacterium]|nr:DUF456 domain-containing protein [Flavobacteriaceae bacterium]